MIALCWGTVEGVGLSDLIDVAADAGFEGITVTPAMYFAARRDGHTATALRHHLDRRGVMVAMIDPLIRALPGSPAPEDVGPRFRATFEHGEDDCFEAAAALGAPALNVAHYLCAPAARDELVAVIGALARRGAEAKVEILVEFMPEGSIPDIAEAVAIIDAVDHPNCGLMLDTWHLYRTSGGPGDLRGLTPGVIRAVQASDALLDLRGTGAEPPTRDRLLPGQGDIPLVDILSLALGNNPDAVIAAEVFNRELRTLPPAERAQRTAHALSAVLAAAYAAGP